MLLSCIAAAASLLSCAGLSARFSDRTAGPVNMWAIDMTHMEVDGRHYAVWSGWEGEYIGAEAPRQNLYIAEMTFHDGKPYVRLGKRALLSEPEKGWELKQGEHISLLEGPSALCHDKDVFLLYSTRGSWTRHYKIGCLKLKDRKLNLLDSASWKKLDQPVFQGEVCGKDGNSIFGVGHASYVTSPDGREHWICFHAKTSEKPGWNDRKVFLQKFSFDADGNPFFGKPADPSVPMRRPSGELEIERENGVSHPSETFTNPLYRGADPWVTKHQGRYYYCGVGPGRSVYVAESAYLTRFEKGSDIMEAGAAVWHLPPAATGKWNVASLWAPEIHHIGSRWYIFYAAGQQTESPFWSQRTGVLVSDESAFGPYRENDDSPLFTGEYP